MIMQRDKQWMHNSSKIRYDRGYESSTCIAPNASCPYASDASSSAAITAFAAGLPVICMVIAAAAAGTLTVKLKNGNSGARSR